MKISLIEPFHTGSHATWAEEYARYSRHQVELLTLSGRRWKWRMHGGAVTLARQFMAGDCEADLLLASDMLDLTTFLGLTREKSARLPTALYFHENQLTYPWSPNGANPAQQRAHYAFINYTSALAADAVLFNSRYHLEAFTGQLPEFLSSFCLLFRPFLDCSRILLLYRRLNIFETSINSFANKYHLVPSLWLIYL